MAQPFYHLFPFALDHLGRNMDATEAFQKFHGA